MLEKNGGQRSSLLFSSQGLQLIFNDLIHSIENGRKSEDITCKSPIKRRGRRSVTLSCKQMKDILQSWLHYIDNQKVSVLLYACTPFQAPPIFRMLRWVQS